MYYSVYLICKVLIIYHFGEKISVKCSQYVFLQVLNIISVLFQLHIKSKHPYGDLPWSCLLAYGTPPKVITALIHNIHPPLLPAHCFSWEWTWLTRPIQDWQIPWHRWRASDINQQSQGVDDDVSFLHAVSCVWFQNDQLQWRTPLNWERHYIKWKTAREDHEHKVLDIHEAYFQSQSHWKGTYLGVSYPTFDLHDQLIREDNEGCKPQEDFCMRHRILLYEMAHFQLFNLLLIKDPVFIPIQEGDTQTAQAIEIFIFALRFLFWRTHLLSFLNDAEAKLIQWTISSSRSPPTVEKHHQ